MKQILTNALVLAAVSAGAAMPSHWDGGRVPPVHRLAVNDVVGDSVVPNDPNALPVSTKNTCNKCHDYAEIAKGWHFNASSTNVCAGRMGEPWFVIDPATGTQLPMSLRGYPGTFRPADVGMNSFDFTWMFGRNLPGGDIAAPDCEGLTAGRWNVSGPLEINCFACHDQSGMYDFSEYVRQIARQNFAWAMTAAMGWGYVDGMGERMPDYWGIMNGKNPDDSIFRVPASIAYDKNQFDSKNRLVLKVGKPKNESCLNCHGSSASGAPQMSIDGDVHLRAGMSCTDCHRNGVDHKIARGYDHKGISAEAMSLTCAGCHVADKGKAGRFGAPAPKHIGFPIIHFEKFACTTCHSGVTPNGELGTVTTSRANRMGVYGQAKWLTDAPFIQEPVFVKNATGKIEPRRMVWPAYWATRTKKGVTPLETAKVAEIAGSSLSVMKDVGAVLAMLDSNPNLAARGLRPVLAVDGKLFRTNVDGIPVPFGEQAGLNGYFYVEDPSRGQPVSAKAEDENLDELTKAVTAALAKVWPKAEKKPYQAIIAEGYDPAFDFAAAGEKKFAECKASADAITAQMIAKEKADLDKMSAEDRKVREEEIAVSVKDTFISMLSSRYEEEQKAKSTLLRDLHTTIEASAYFADAMVCEDSKPKFISGAVVTSGKLFFKNRGEDITSVEAPANAAKADFGLYDITAKTFTSLQNVEANAQVAQLAGTSAALTESMLSATLKKLAKAGIEKPVYIAHGQVWEVVGDTLQSAFEKVAEPVSWAIGHDVRPARMARGAKPIKCADCHTVDSKFFFTDVVSTGPLLTAKKMIKSQSDFMGVSGSYNKALGAMFLMRPYFKIFLWVVFAFLAFIAVAFTAAAVPVLLGNGGVPYGTRKEKVISMINRLSGCAMGLACAYLALSGLFGWVSGGMTGYILVFHQVAGGLFCAATLALIWFRGASRIKTKRSFWWMLAMALATLVVFTAVAPWMTIFGTDWQHILLQAHRCTTFCFLAVGAWMLLSGGRKE